MFVVTAGRVEVRDLGSHNGILAGDGRRVATLPLAPGERVQELRAGFAASMKDPALLQEAKNASFEIRPVSGEEIEKILAETFAISPDVVARTADLLK